MKLRLLQIWFSIMFELDWIKKLFLNTFLIQLITVSMNLFDKVVIVICDSDLKD